MAISFPLSCWMALAIGGVEVGTELAGNGYVREPVVFDLTDDGETAANTATVQWTMATGSWGVLDTVQIWDSASGGNLIGSALAITPVQINQYDRARVQAGGFHVVTSYVNYGFGRYGFGVGRYMTRDYLSPVGSGIGSPYGVGPYGIGAYATVPLGVLLERTFEQAPHVCAPGQWVVGPFGVTA